MAVAASSARAAQMQMTAAKVSVESIQAKIQEHNALQQVHVQSIGSTDVAQEEAEGGRALMGKTRVGRGQKE